MSILLERRAVSSEGIDLSLYENQYLTTEALESGNISFNIPAGVPADFVTSISYRKNKGVWTTTNNSSSAITITVPVVAGDVVEWKGIIPRSTRVAGSPGYTSKFVANEASFNLYGNLLSLFWGDSFIGKTDWPWRVNNGSLGLGAYALFEETNVVDASNLILPVLNLYISGSSGCYFYGGLFRNCTSLIYPPAVLPATTIGPYAYHQMFQGCTSLTTMPNMESIQDTTANGRAAYMGMFDGCTALQYNTQQTIHINKATYQGCQNMFKNCSSIVNAPDIEVYELGNPLSGNGVAASFESMFYGCTSLETPPERIDLDTIDNGTFSAMFANCTSLEYAPIINIRKINYINNTLTPNPGRMAFKEMFVGCTSLIDGSGINIYFPDTSGWSGQQTCMDIFRNCTHLENGPSINVNGNVIVNGNQTFSRSFWNCSNLDNYDIELNYEIDSSATITAGEGWGNYQTFYQCTNIVSGPRIIRPSLRTRELEGMFTSCTSLRDVYIKCDENNAGDAFRRWLYGTGTLSGVTRTVHQAGSATLPANSTDGVPSGWTLDTTDWTAQRHVRMTLYMSDFPEGQNREDNIQGALERPDGFEVWEYCGETLTINGVTYFVWLNNINTNNRLLTTTDNFRSLTKASLADSYDLSRFDLGKDYDWLYGEVGPDDTAIAVSKESMINHNYFIISIVRNQG